MFEIAIDAGVSKSDESETMCEEEGYLRVQDLLFDG